MTRKEKLERLDCHYGDCDKCIFDNIINSICHCHEYFNEATDKEIDRDYNIMFGGNK